MKNKILMVAGGLLLLSILFYWFQYRPSKIRGYCDWKVKSETRWEIDWSDGDERAAYSASYASCLHEKGL